MKNKEFLSPGKILIIIGVFFILSAILIITVNTLTAVRAGNLAEEILSEMNSSMRAEPSKTGGKKGESVMNIRGNDYVGVLIFPSLALSLPIMEDWSEDNSKVSPCKYSGSPQSGDFIIAGHNYKKHFGSLKKIAYDDTIWFADVSGLTYIYKVRAIEDLYPYQTDELKSGEWDLTLFTCTDSGKTRLTVRCKLIEVR